MSELGGRNYEEAVELLGKLQDAGLVIHADQRALNFCHGSLLQDWL